jgi:hypothetical protein
MMICYSPSDHLLRNDSTSGRRGFLRLIGCSMCSVDGLTLLSQNITARKKKEKKTREFCVVDGSQAKSCGAFISREIDLA